MRRGRGGGYFDYFKFDRVKKKKQGVGWIKREIRLLVFEGTANILPSVSFGGGCALSKPYSLFNGRHWVFQDAGLKNKMLVWG